ncbi:TRAP transporter small permease [Desulfovibrio sp. Fe33]|uniref:TRAP transporter small permease n=1 Tax=Desulfovibrio sp. Fe33 TaxID=3020842 RepID=UPI00234D7643|nr:TRAP transporter small permease [Desulfovibrio sp. Fe33]
MQTQKTTSLFDLAGAVERVAFRLNYVLERLCALLVAAMIGVVWFGILERYALAMGATWTEEMARYLMIWAALLAVPCCAYRREHIGLDLVFSRLPLNWQMPARMVLDLLGLAFFLFLAWYGVTMAGQGAHQFATIFGMTMLVPFTSVPVAAGLTAFQIVAVMIRDAARVDPLFTRKEAS